jgi:hypothetical protein
VIASQHGHCFSQKITSLIKSPNANYAAALEANLRFTDRRPLVAELAESISDYGHVNLIRF